MDERWATGAAPRMAANRARPYLLVSPAMAVTLLFFAGGMVVLAVFSFRPFVEGRIGAGATVGNYRAFLAGPYYWGVLATSMKLGALVAAACAVVGYPLACALDRLRAPVWRNLAYFLLLSPLLTSVVVRTYGWSLVLGDRGFVNSALLALHVVSQPLKMLYEFSGVSIALVHILLPFMVLPIVGALGQIDPALKEAASDLGAGRLRVFTRVILPLSLQGLIVGCQLVFALTISAFATPSLMGGGRVQVLATLIYNDVGNLDWPMAAVESYLLLALALLCIGAFNWLVRRARS
jgi:putative spermidine/putrescine transport system permease protein